MGRCGAVQSWVLKRTEDPEDPPLLSVYPASLR